MPITPRLIRIKPPTSQMEATEEAQPGGGYIIQELAHNHPGDIQHGYQGDRQAKVGNIHQRPGAVGNHGIHRQRHFFAESVGSWRRGCFLHPARHLPETGGNAQPKEKKAPGPGGFQHLPQETRAHQPRRNHIPGNLLVGKQIKQCVEQFSGNGFKQAALPLLLHPVHHIRPGRIHLTGKINQPLGRFLQITVNQEYALSPGFFAGHVHGQMMTEVAG